MITGDDIEMLEEEARAERYEAICAAVKEQTGVTKFSFTPGTRFVAAIAPSINRLMDRIDRLEAKLDRES